MTPAGLQHGDTQPMDLGLGAGGMTPAGLHHGGQLHSFLLILTFTSDFLWAELQKKSYEKYLKFLENGPY